MAIREITIRVPVDLEELFSLKVPADEQEQFVIDALRRKLSEMRTREERDAIFIAACDAAPLDVNEEENFDEWVAELKAKHLIEE